MEVAQPVARRNFDGFGMYLDEIVLWGLCVAMVSYPSSEEFPLVGFKYLLVLLGMLIVTVIIGDLHFFEFSKMINRRRIFKHIFENIIREVEVRQKIVSCSNYCRKLYCTFKFLKCIKMCSLVIETRWISWTKKFSAMSMIWITLSEKRFKYDIVQKLTIMVLPENRTLNPVSVFPRRIRCPSTQNRNFSKLRAAGHGWIPRVSKRTASSICASSRDFPLFGPRFPEEVFAWTSWRLISPRRNEFLRSPWRRESAARGRTLVVQPPWSWVTRHAVEFTRRRRLSPPDPAGLSARHRPSFDSLSASIIIPSKCGVQSGQPLITRGLIDSIDLDQM